MKYCVVSILVLVSLRLAVTVKLCIANILSETGEKFNSLSCNIVLVSVKNSSNIGTREASFDSLLPSIDFTSFLSNYHSVISLTFSESIISFSNIDGVRYSTTNGSDLKLYFRFSRACSLALYEESSDVQINLSFIDMRWIEFHIPGGVFGSFHLFLFRHFHKNRASRFSLMQMRHSHGIFIENPSSNELLRFSGKLFNSHPNWNRRDMIQKVDPGNAYMHMDHYKKTGMWTNYMIPLVYYAAEYLNATLKLESVYSMPARGKLKSGEYDDFVKPLITGSGHMCTFINPAYFRPPGLIQFSKMVSYGGVSFVTALPRPDRLSIVEALKQPFTLTTWIILLVIVAVMIALIFVSEIILSFNPGIDPVDILKNSRNDLSKVALFIIKSILEQPYSGQDIHQVLRKLNFWRVAALWSLLSIIICGMYKSKLVAAFVKPKYVSPPRNFEELSNSSFKIYGILFTNTVEVVLREINDSLAQELLSRTQDTPWPFGARECLDAILNWNSVCMSYEMVLSSYAPIYLTNSKGQPVYKMSEESKYPFISVFGISKYYPEVLGNDYEEDRGAVNMMIDRLQPSGLVNYWSHMNIAESVKKGMHMSRKSNFSTPTVDIYTESGTDQPKTLSQNQYHYFLGPFLVGIATTILVFGFELILNQIIHFHQGFTGDQLRTHIISFTW